MSLITLKLLLLLFWAAWFSLVLITNTLAELKIIGVLPERWKLASQNLEAIRKTTAVYSLPDAVNKLLFIAAILWQALIVIAFWAAFFLSLARGKVDLRPTYLAFALSLALWAAFMLMDEFFRHYEGERSHIQFFIAELASLLLLMAG